ncbi:MAG: hypothetical protein KDD62_13070, partial [Bdellovibrionales bacterium]|nr:hypothetical protein [Bdellovibrionales bacterium]
MTHKHAPPATSLPASIRAVGNLCFLGNALSKTTRLTLSGQYWSWEDSLLFECAQMGDSLVWLRVPHIAGIQLGDLFVSRQLDQSISNSDLRLFDLVNPVTQQREIPLALLDHEPKESADIHAVRMFERFIAQNDQVKLQEFQNLRTRTLESDARYLFAQAALHYQGTSPDKAKDGFYRAQQLGHPLTEEALIACHYRERNDEIATRSWYSLEYLHKNFLTCAEALPSKSRHLLCEILALHARANQDYELAFFYATEGLNENIQSYLLLEVAWQAATQLHKDSMALTWAQLALSVQPGHMQHYLNAFDSAMLLGKFDLARQYLSALLCQPAAIDEKLERCFLFCEAVQDWQTIATISKRMLALREQLNTASHVYLAESLIESNNFDLGLSLLELKLSTAPHDSRV